MSATARQPKPRISLRGLQKYLDVVEAPKVENRKLVGALIIMAVAMLLMGAGMYRMLPLKERVPYVVVDEVDSSGQPTGRVEVREGGMSHFQPQQAHLRYHLNQWVQDFLSIDEYTESVRLPRSNAMLRGQALNDWRVYLASTHQPIERLRQNPEYRERAEVISMNFLNESTVLIRVKLTTRNGTERRLSINLQTAIIPPTTDDEVYRNPIGLWITTFGVSNESL